MARRRLQLTLRYLPLLAAMAMSVGGWPVGAWGRTIESVGFGIGPVDGPAAGLEVGLARLSAAEVQRWIADLDAESLDVRDRAHANLADARRCSLNLIGPRCFDPALSPEQRLRLESAAEQIFRGTPRAGMGVAFGDTTAQGVMVGRTVEGFDARRALLVGDVIRGIDSRSIRSADEVRAAILSHDPGEQVPLALLRNGEALTVTVRLGSFARLDNPTPPDEQSLRMAWNVRRARMAREAGAIAMQPIDAANAPADPEAALDARSPVAWRPPRALDDGVLPVTLVAGGEPRGGVDWGSAAAFALRGLPVVDPFMEARRELGGIQQMIRDTQGQLAENLAAVEDPNTPAQARQALLTQNALLEMQLRQLEIREKIMNEQILRMPQRIQRVVP